MIRILKVAGSSLSPFFLSGDYVVVSSCSWLTGEVSPGDDIVFIHPAHGRLIKNVTAINRDGSLIVAGHQPESIDSADFGPVPRDWVTGKVLWRITSS